MCYAAMQAQSAKSHLGLLGYYIQDFEGERMVYPLQPMLFGRIHPQSGQREALLGQYGLLPPWVDDAKGGPKFGRFCYNARSESIFEKPSFRDAILRQRALIPVEAFFEFPDNEKPLRHRYKVRRQDNEAFFFAGLWSYHPGYKAFSCSVVTTEPMALFKGTHSRSPVILNGAQAHAWMDPAMTEPKKIAALMKTAASELFVLDVEEWAGKDKGGQEELPLF